MLIDQDDFDLSFRGYLLRDCGVRNRNVFQLSAENDAQRQQHDFTAEEKVESVRSACSWIALSGSAPATGR